MKEETKQMGLMKKLTSAIVASSLVFSLVGTAAAAYTPSAGEQAGARMQALGILNGKPGAGLALNDEITRAELVTTIVRAFGKEQDAALLKGSTVFPDITNHWASGNIAMASALVEKAGGDAIGMPDGKFNPDGKLTPAQAVAFLMKFIGVKRDASQAWPNDYLNQAVKVGLITAEDKTVIAPMLNENATRGLVFYLFDRAFYNYDLGNGQTFYTKFVHPSAINLSVDTLAATTTSDKVTVTGKVAGANEVYVGTTKVTLAADGSFSSDFALPEIKADAYSVTVTARDIAGNTATKTQQVTRTVGTAAKIEAPASITVAAGATVDLPVVVKDAAGNVVKDAVVAGTSDFGTYAAGKFTAGDKTGTGTITVGSGDLSATVNVTVNAGDLASLTLTTDPATTNVSVGTPLKLVVTGADAKGNAVDVTGKVSFTAVNGVVDANGHFAATVAGAAKVTATVGTVSKDLNLTVFGAASKLAVTNTKSLVANGVSTDTVTVNVQDVNGYTVGNYNGNVTLTVVGGTTALNVQTGTATWGTAQTVAAVNGVATFTVKSAAAGTADVTARVQATAGSLTGALKDISIVKPVLTKFAASVDVANIEANPAAGASVTVKAYDQENQAVATYGTYSLTFSSSDTNILKIVDGSGVPVANNALILTYSNGFSGTASTSFNVKATVIPGTATLTATVKDSNGVVVTTIPVNTLSVATATATAAAKVQLIGADGITFSATDTTAKTFKVALLDQAGNVLSSNGSFAPSVVVKDADGNVVSTGAGALFTVATGTLSNGIQSFTVVPSGANGNAGTFTIVATSGTLTSSTATMTVNPAAAVSATTTLTPDNATIAGDGVSKVVLTAQFKDAKGNNASFNGPVTLVRNSGTNLSLPAAMTVNAVNGVATWTLTAGYTFGTDNFGIQADLAGTGTAQTLAASQNVATVLTGAPTQLAITSTQTGKAAGDSYTVTVKVLDAQTVAQTVTSDNGRAVNLLIDSGTGTVQNATATTVNGVATFKLTSTLANTVGFHAEATGLTKSAGATAVFAAAAPAKIHLAANAASLQAGSNTTITATYVDAYGNTATGTPDLKTITANGSIGTVSIAATNTGSFTLTAAAYPATGSITAVDNTSANLPVDPLNVNVYNAGFAYKAAIQTIADTTADKTSFTVKVALVDYSGAVLTSQENADLTKVPFKLQVTNPAGGVTTFDNGANNATSYVDGVATYTFSINNNNNAGQYKFAVVDYAGTDLTAAAMGYSASDAALFAGLQTSTVYANVAPATATAVKVVAIDPATGNDSTSTFTFSTSTANVAFVKLAAVDLKGNVVTTFNGTGKLTLSSAANMTLVGADTNGVLPVTITNGYGIAQIQRTGASSGTVAGAIILSGTTYTSAGTSLTIN